MLGALLAMAVVAGEVQVIDADIVRVGGRTYRIYHVDTPRLDSTCSGEARLAEAAVTRMRELLTEAREVDVRPGYDPRSRRIWPHDLSGRRLARITIDGRDLAELLVAEGWAVRWDRHREHNWCLAARRRR